jgi:glycosyltransferase involved in cell wall biosynthesis
MITQIFRNFLSFIINMGIFITFLLLACFYRNKQKKYVVFGTTPIISYAYWAKALKKIIPDTITLMNGFYSSINNKSDFDLYFDDVVPKQLKNIDIYYIRNFFALLFLIKNARLFVTCYDSVCLEGCFKPFEIILLKVAKVKTVVTGYGGDFHLYSQIKDPSLQHALQLSYPLAAINEPEIWKNIKNKQRWANCIIAGFLPDGLGRWDLLMSQTNTLDKSLFHSKQNYSYANGINTEVVISHFPNHRGFKGTEFIKNAIDELISQGFKIKFNIVEKKKNYQVREILKNSDILAEQLIAGAFGLNALEGMATGIPVISNLSNEFLNKVFRRYSFLNECPVVSGTPETIKDVLRVLITNPQLREELGRAGRQYVEKYHSNKTAQYVFGSIYDKLINNKDVDLMNLFHPILSPYNKELPFVKHPLVNNQLPLKYFEK